MFNLLLSLVLSSSPLHASTDEVKSEPVESCEATLVSQPQLITFDLEGQPITPDQPIIGFIEGDGIGPEITPAMQEIVNAAVAKAYKGQRQIHWRELIAGGKAIQMFGEPLPAKTLKDMETYSVSIKGPMETPVGANGNMNFRSLNVAIRKHFCLYSCERPIVKYPNVPTPMNNAENVDIKIFRENTEDIYAGIEFRAGTSQAIRLARFINELQEELKRVERVDEEAGIGIKPMTEKASKAIMRKAMNFAVAENRPSVTIVHKGNIQKFTEGDFRDWAYAVAKTEYRDQIVTEEELYSQFEGKLPAGKILVNDRIADNMFQQTILAPERYSVLVTPNLNGDYLSDQVAALVGGLGIAPGANIGDRGAVFEATHGTAPDIMGQNKANPSSLILSAVMMLHYLGWHEAAVEIDIALRATLTDRIATGDFRKMTDVQLVGTKEFAQALIERIKKSKQPLQ